MYCHIENIDRIFASFYAIELIQNIYRLERLRQFNKITYLNFGI